MSGLRILLDASETLIGARLNSLGGSWRYGLALAGLVATFSGSVQAADLNAAPVTRARPLAASSWAGFYAGFGIGFRSTDNDLTTTSVFLDGVPADLSRNVV